MLARNLSRYTPKTFISSQRVFSIAVYLSSCRPQTRLRPAAVKGPPASLRIPHIYDRIRGYNRIRLQSRNHPTVLKDSSVVLAERARAGFAERPL